MAAEDDKHQIIMELKAKFDDNNGKLKQVSGAGEEGGAVSVATAAEVRAARRRRLSGCSRRGCVTPACLPAARRLSRSGGRWR